MNRRRFMMSVALGSALLVGPALAARPHIKVFKSPTCGCCADWVAHMRRAGFQAQVHDVDPDMLWTLKARTGITPELGSCHTAFVDGYVVEGHVPASDVRRLLAERPDALGLAVPGMPIGSPGMEMGNQREPFETRLVLRGGATRIFERH